MFDRRALVLIFVMLFAAGCGQQAQQTTSSTNSGPKPSNDISSLFAKPPIETQENKGQPHHRAPDVSSLFATPGSHAEKTTETPPSPTKRKHHAPVKFRKLKLETCPLYETIVDLDDADTYLQIALANNALTANAAGETHGHEEFDSLVRKYPGTVVLNGTFFSKDDEERVMGNMVSNGRFLKYSQWENFGTTFGLKENNEPEMVTARVDGAQPDWTREWFSITCGPRLLKDGEEAVAPEREGFSDSHVLGIGPRVAMGYSKAKRQLMFVTFVNGLSLKQEAHLMKLLGCTDAMNLDGGASRALAYNGKTVMRAGRPLTNVIVVYDKSHPAPSLVVKSWEQFQYDGHAVPGDNSMMTSASDKSTLARQ